MPRLAWGAQSPVVRSSASTEHGGSLRARGEEGHILPDNGARPDPHGCQTDARDWWLSSEADSHQTKAPIESGRAKPVSEAKGTRRQPPATEERRACEWWAVGGRYGVPPLEWVAPDEVGAREMLFPKKKPAKSEIPIKSPSWNCEASTPTCARLNGVVESRNQ